jgi:hypothetical protein
MADLAAILKDPNYVNANAATKAAIFDKYATQDPNFANANPATQQAIRSKFGLESAAPIEAPAPAAAALSEIPGQRIIPEWAQRNPITYGVVSTARDVLGPTVQALGAAGGAIGGAAAATPTGPVGMAAGGVAGAGLGYGTATEGLEALDVALGFKKPRTGAAAVVEPLKNVVEGATYEVGGRVIAPYIGKAIGAVADLRQIPLQKAAKIAKGALGDDLPQVLNALRNASPDVSAAQATAGITNPTWQALIERRLASDPKFVLNLKNMNEAEGVNALAKLAGGATATEARGTSEVAKKNLNVITTPMREASLGRANLGKYVADEAAAREANDLAVAVGSGGDIDPVRFAAQATGAEKALRSVGVKPLESSALADKIAAISKNKSFAENDLIEGATTRVANAIRKWSENGVIDANALEAIRKNAVDAAIANLRPGADATTQRNAAAKVMSKIKPLIDDAIESAGGAGWRDYLATHAKGMQQIAEKKLSGKALELYKTNKDEFVRLVQGESDDVVEKILGPGNYDIAKEVSDNTLNVLQDQAAKVIRDANIKTQVAGGQDALKELMLQNLSKFRLPSYITAVAATTNKAMQILENKIGTKTMGLLTESFKTPGATADLLETLPGAERNRVAKLLSDPKSWVQKAAAPATLGATNALAPAQQNQNALAP